MLIEEHDIRRYTSDRIVSTLGVKVDIRERHAVPREISVNRPCKEVVSAIRKALGAADFRIEQSFDLRAALALVPGCTCPHHGTAQCTCEYNVMLVYGKYSPVPVTLVAHGRDAQSWITLADSPNGAGDVELVADIMQTLMFAPLITHDETPISAKEQFTMAKDPVCGMEIDEKTAAATSEYKGKTYYFCAPGCKQAFDKNPEKYLSTDHQNTGHHSHHH